MKEKERLLDKIDKTLKLKKIEKHKSIQEKGITLIALVVTIIILLILVGVTLNIALSDNGLFSRTKEIVEKYKEAENEEQQQINHLEALMCLSIDIGAEVTGYEPAGDNSICTIEAATSGASTAQNIGREKLKWRIWDFDGNTLRIIGDPTSTKLTLKGATGYNNGVWALDYICKTLYSNNEEGVSATNLRKTDIQKVSTYEYTQYRHIGTNGTELPNGDINSTTQFGESITYNNSSCPTMWDLNDKNWKYEWNDNGNITKGDQECTTWENIGTDNGKIAGTVQGSSQVTIKQSYYWHNYTQNEFINDKYYNLIFKKADESTEEPYWVSSRYAYLAYDFCYFGLQVVETDYSNENTWSNYLCRNTAGFDHECSRAFRPIVSIDLNSSNYILSREVQDDNKIIYKLNYK